MLFIFVISFNTAWSQTEKIGYTNLDLILSYMPESKNMQQNLQTYQTHLGKKCNIKRDYFQNKMEEYQKLIGTGDPRAKSMEADLVKLEKELQETQVESERSLQQKRSELLQPIFSKVEKALKIYAKSKGYSKIINSHINGASIVLYSDEKDDVTKGVLTQLGISTP